MSHECHAQYPRVNWLRARSVKFLQLLAVPASAGSWGTAFLRSPPFITPFIARQPTSIGPRQSNMPKPICVS
jgi:hypothetical protein